LENDGMIAYCGIICTDCRAYTATQKGEQRELSQLAKEWSSEGYHLSAEDCLCEGCIGEGRLASFARQCEIRRCAVARGVKTCGHCSDYPCDSLQETFQRSPHARAVLDEIAQKRSP
jgi:hypothetical protein